MRYYSSFTFSGVSFNVISRFSRILPTDWNSFLLFLLLPLLLLLLFLVLSLLLLLLLLLLFIRAINQSITVQSSVDGDEPPAISKSSIERHGRNLSPFFKILEIFVWGSKDSCWASYGFHGLSRIVCFYLTNLGKLASNTFHGVLARFPARVPPSAGLTRIQTSNTTQIGRWIWQRCSYFAPLWTLETHPCPVSQSNHST